MTFASSQHPDSDYVKNASTALRLGDLAPNFTCESSVGSINLKTYAQEPTPSWVLFFSHPADFTPVCTTELGQLAKSIDAWTQRSCKLLGLSVDSVKSHQEWIKDIQGVAGLSPASPFPFPILADVDGRVASLYGMLDSPLHDPTNVMPTRVTDPHAGGPTTPKKILPMTVRSVFLLDPSLKVRAIWTYPASTGRNIDEILRVLDSLQLVDKNKIATPVNWKPGDDVIIRADVQEEEAKQLFPKHTSVKPYLRYTSCPK